MDNWEANSHQHPPACTCVDCTNKRLGRRSSTSSRRNAYTNGYKIEHPSQFGDPINKKKNGSSEANKINEIMATQHSTRNQQSQSSGSIHAQPKQHSSSALGGFIVLLVIVFIIGLIGIGAYSAYLSYHDNVVNWGKQEYNNLANNAVQLKDKTLPIISGEINKVSTAVQSAPSTVQPSKPTSAGSNSGSRVFTNDTSVEAYSRMFNAYREQNGRSPLIFTDDLNRIATLRLAEIKINYNHSSAGGYNRHLAENINMISSGSLSNTAAFNSWRNSPGHNANMLDPSYKYTGYADGDGYAVQVFTEWPTVNGVPQLPPGYYWP